MQPAAGAFDVPAFLLADVYALTTLLANSLHPVANR